MIVFSLHMHADAANRQELINILHLVSGPTASQPGCCAVNIYQGMDGGSDVLYLEKWSDMERLRDHVQSNLFYYLLTAMELATRQPELAIYDTNQTHGMDFIEQFRM